MVFWQIILALSAVAAFFILWPLIKSPFAHKSWSRRVDHDQTQVVLFEEHLADLEQALANGDLEQEQFAQLKVELQKTLLAESSQGGNLEHKRGGKKILLGVALAVPVLGMALYSQLGAKKDWEIYQFLADLPKVETRTEYDKRLRELVVMVQARLNQRPDNYSLQNLLAQMSMALQDYDQAVVAYRAVLDIFPQDPRVMSSLAQALFYRGGNTVDEEVREYTHKALALAPMMPEMLGLAGIDAKNQGDLRGAIRYWTQAVQYMDKNSKVAQGYLNGIIKAEQALAAGGETLDAPSVTEQDKPAAASITLNVSLSDKAAVSGNETLFVYARAWQGAKMPLAIQKMAVSELPKTLQLDESMAMAPGMSITSSPQLELVARVSRSGSPAAKSGDWQGSIGPIKLDELTGAVDIVIDQQVP